MTQGLLDWLSAKWVIGAGFMAASLIAVSPIISLPISVYLIFLHSPAYMIHQVEEHTNGRFQQFANERLFGGKEALTITAILIINLPLVWGVNLIALYLAYALGAAWGLTAAYLMLVNALAHVVTSMRFRTYNPGLVTSFALFFPLSCAAIWSVGWTSGVAPHVTGAILAIIVHLAIVAVVLKRSQSLDNLEPITR